MQQRCGGTCYPHLQYKRTKLYDATSRMSVIFILTATEGFNLTYNINLHELCIIYLKFLKFNYIVLHLLLHLCNTYFNF